MKSNLAEHRQVTFAICQMSAYWLSLVILLVAR